MKPIAHEEEARVGRAVVADDERKEVFAGVEHR
jgi:hypothetical protein